jgi:hypothetical protein
VTADTPEDPQLELAEAVDRVNEIDEKMKVPH